jgi:hypothetical protein
LFELLQCELQVAAIGKAFEWFRVNAWYGLIPASIAGQRYCIPY